MHGEGHVGMGGERYRDMLNPGSKHIEKVEQFGPDLRMGPYERRPLPERFLPALRCRD